MARSWTVNGVSDQTREAAAAATQEAGMPIGSWIEQALQKALDEGLEPGVSIEEIEARVRAAVAEGLRPVQQALARVEAAGNVSNVLSLDLARARMRRRRAR